MTSVGNRLGGVVDTLGMIAVAVSGGVDSMTLAAFIHRRARRGRAVMVHAVSPAVPPPATARVRDSAKREGWDLVVLSAGEFEDPEYRSNPLNRCYFCKTNLYAAVSARLDRQIVSGTNLDDLSEYRPGLDAARSFAVRHPFLEAKMDKSDVRALARALGLGDIAELPASPCLSSRVETLIPIDPETLVAIHGVEEIVSQRLHPRTVRCRVRSSGTVVELDTESLAALTDHQKAELETAIRKILPLPMAASSLSFATYRVGSAFIGGRA